MDAVPSGRFRQEVAGSGPSGSDVRTAFNRQPDGGLKLFPTIHFRLRRER